MHASGIAIHEEGYSLVTDCSRYCLSIFDPQGKKIHTIGRFILTFAVTLDSKSNSLYVGNDGCILKYSEIVM